MSPESLYLSGPTWYTSFQLAQAFYLRYSFFVKNLLKRKIANKRTWESQHERAF